MSINRFMNPIKENYKETFVDQYVPMPFEMMQKQLENKQKKHDVAQTNWDVMQNKMGEQLMDVDNKVMSDKVNSIRENVTNALDEAGGDFGAVSRTISNTGADYNQFITTGAGGEGKRQLAKYNSEVAKINAVSGMSGEDKTNSINGLKARYDREGGVMGGATIENAMTYDTTGMLKELNTIIKDTIGDGTSTPKAEVSTDGYIRTSTNDQKELTPERVETMMSLMKGKPEFQSYVAVKWQNAQELGQIPEGIETKEEYEELLFGEMFGGFDAKAYVQNKKTEKVTSDATQVARAKAKKSLELKTKDVEIDVSGVFSQQIDSNTKYEDDDGIIKENVLKIFTSNYNDIGKNLVGNGEKSYLEDFGRGRPTDEVKTEYDTKIKQAMLALGVYKDETEIPSDGPKDGDYMYLTKYIAQGDENLVKDAINKVFGGNQDKAKKFIKSAEDAYKKIETGRQVEQELDNELIEKGYLKEGASSSNKAIAARVLKKKREADQSDLAAGQAVHAYLQANPPFNNDLTTQWKNEYLDADDVADIANRLTNEDETAFDHLGNDSKVNPIIENVQKYRAWNKGRAEVFEALTPEKQQEITEYKEARIEIQKLQDKYNKLRGKPIDDNSRVNYAPVVKDLLDKAYAKIDPKYYTRHSYEDSKGQGKTIDHSEWKKSIHGYKLLSESGNNAFKKKGFATMVESLDRKESTEVDLNKEKNGKYYRDKKNEILRNRLKTKAIEIPTNNTITIQRKQTDGSYKKQTIKAQDLVKEADLESKLRTFKAFTDQNKDRQSLMDYIKSTITAPGQNVKGAAAKYAKELEDKFSKMVSTAEFTGVKNPESNKMEMIFSDGNKKFRVPVMYGSAGDNDALGIGSGGVIKLTKGQKTQIGLTEDIYKARLSNLKNTTIGDTKYGVTIRTNKAGVDGSLNNFGEQLASGDNFGVELNLKKMGYYLTDDNGKRIKNVNIPSEKSVQFLNAYKSILAGNTTDATLAALKITTSNRKSKEEISRIAKKFIRLTINTQYKFDLYQKTFADQVEKYKNMTSEEKRKEVEKEKQKLNETSIMDFALEQAAKNGKGKTFSMGRGPLNRYKQYEHGMGHGSQGPDPEDEEDEDFVSYEQKKEAEEAMQFNNFVKNRNVIEPNSTQEQAPAIPEMVTEEMVLDSNGLPPNLMSPIPIAEQKEETHTMPDGTVMPGATHGEEEGQGEIDTEVDYKNQDANVVPDNMTVPSITDVPVADENTNIQSPVDDTIANINNIPSTEEIKISKKLDVNNPSNSANSWSKEWNNIKNEPLKRKIITDAAGKLITTPAKDAGATLEVIKSKDISEEDKTQIIKTELLEGVAGAQEKFEIIKEGIAGFIGDSENIVNDVLDGFPDENLRNNPLTKAIEYLGLNERGTPAEQKVIYDMLYNAVGGEGKTFTKPEHVKRTAWCAAFINHIFSEYGYKSVAGEGENPYKNIRAADYQELGKEVKFDPTNWSDTTSAGDIVVIKKKSSNAHHVTIAAGTSEDGYLRMMGGNQSNKVNVMELNPNTHEVVSVRSLKNMKKMDEKLLKKVIDRAKKEKLYYTKNKKTTTK